MDDKNNEILAKMGKDMERTAKASERSAVASERVADAMEAQTKNQARLNAKASRSRDPGNSELVSDHSENEEPVMPAETHGDMS